MKFAVATIVALTLGMTAVTAGAKPPSQLEPLAFLIGQWNAVGSGTPGEASGSATFAFGLQDRVMLRTNYADYPATATTPATRHDDLMVIYAAEGSGIRADYYDNEGHVIRYAVTAPAPGEAVFASDLVDGAPRFRLSYRLGPDGVLRGEFALAPPGKPEAFAPYLTWESRKTPAEGNAKP